jgi:hypothetical protein
MATTIDAVYNPEDTWLPTEEGKYPAHISSLSTKDVNTRAGQAIVVNMQYKIASEAADLTQKLWEMDGYDYTLDSDGEKIPKSNGSGKQEEGSCKHLVGREFYDNGWFIFVQGTSSGKNKRYFELLDTLGVKCEETTDEDGKTVKKLVLLEESDVVGRPVEVNVERTTYVTKDTRHLPSDQQEHKVAFKVKTIANWEGGTPISPEELTEDVPF